MTGNDQNRNAIEERLFALLDPDDAAVRRVKERALSPSTPRYSARFVAIAGGLVALLGTGVIWQIGARPRKPEVVVTIEQSEDDLMLARAPDGSVWVLGPAEERVPSPGAMEIVLEGGR